MGFRETFHFGLWIFNLLLFELLMLLYVSFFCSLLNGQPEMVAKSNNTSFGDHWLKQTIQTWYHVNIRPHGFSSLVLWQAGWRMSSSYPRSIGFIFVYNFDRYLFSGSN